MTLRYCSRPKISVTLTEMPAAMVSVMAGQPSLVPGILMRRLGWSTIRQSSAASLTVSPVSWAKPGDTSIETRPSTPSVASKTGRITLQASRTSSVVMTCVALSTSAPAAASSRTCGS